MTFVVDDEPDPVCKLWRAPKHVEELFGRDDQHGLLREQRIDNQVELISV
jgi:hypothetical protein